MKIGYINSGLVYEKMMEADKEKKKELYRYELMKPFEKKWAHYNVPITAKQKGGYDVLMASRMLGYLPPENVDASISRKVEFVKEEALYVNCKQQMENVFNQYEKAGITLPIKEYLFTILLADPLSVYTKLSEGYCGDGGIPGFIFLSVDPSENIIKRLPAALAHECNHNVRFQYIKWRNDITLEEMMITEGLAENFAVHLYGKENLGPWVSKVTKEELEEYIKPIIKEGRTEQGLDRITAYLYGDEIAMQLGYEPVGLPFCAGYACGYAMVEYYLNKTKEDIYRATIRPYQEISEKIKEFWDE